jgi:hypothetical protein
MSLPATSAHAIMKNRSQLDAAPFSDLGSKVGSWNARHSEYIGNTNPQATG